MTLILQWTALVVCILCTAWRLPAMLKGRNRGLFWIFAMASFSVGLSIEPLYLPVDALLGGINIANVLLRISLFAVFFLLARKVAAAYKSPLATKLISGPIGLTVLGLCSLGIWLSFLVSDKGTSSAGMAALPYEPALAIYARLGMGYMGYAAACVLLPTARAAFSHRPLLDRVSALLLSVGFLLVVATVPLEIFLEPSDPVIGVVSFSAVLLVAVGLALVWVSFLRRPVSRTAGH